MTRPTPRRKLIGTAPTLIERVRVYRTDDALEVEYVTTFEISRRRVFFDEIVLVLLHRRGTPPLVKLAWLLLFLAAIGTGMAKIYELLVPTAVLLGIFAVVGLPSWTVTAYGRRSLARMRYGLREQKARAVYAEICRLAAEAQSALASRTPPPAAPAIETPAGELPPAPPAQSPGSPGSAGSAESAEAWPAPPPVVPGDESSG